MKINTTNFNQLPTNTQASFKDQLTPDLTKRIGGKLLNDLFQGNLEELDLSGMPITASDLEIIISHCQNLKKLSLAATPLSNISCLKKCKSLIELDLSHCQYLSSESFQTLAELSSLTHLSCEGCLNFNNESIKSLQHSFNLKFCDFSECINISDEGIYTLPLFLESLFLKNLPKLSHKCLDPLSTMAHLIRLDLSENNICFKRLGVLAALPKLKDLFLWRCNSLIDDNLHWLLMSPIEKLDISFCLQLTDRSISHFKNIKVLYLDGCPFITDSGLMQLIESQNLKSISLHRCPTLPVETADKFPPTIKVDFPTHLKKRVDDQFLNTLLQNSLEKLDLSTMLIDTNTLEIIVSHCPNLKKLSLAKTSVTNISCLKKCKFLRELDLSYCQKLSSQDFQILSELPSLTHLSCEGCLNFNDESIKNLQQCFTLKFCDFSECINISDEGIDALPPQLESLFLRNLPKLSDRFFDSLSKMTRLVELDLSVNKICFNKLNTLTSVTQLKSLFLWRCSSLTDDDLNWLKISSVEKLDVSFCHQLTNKSMDNFKKIQDLSLDGCLFITDSGLLQLAESKDLRSLSLYRSPTISIDTIHRFPSKVKIHFPDRHKGESQLLCKL